jgi:hypothetical protein
LSVASISSNQIYSISIVNNLTISTTSSGQSFNLTLTGTLTMLSSIKPQYITITFYRNNTRYMYSNIYLYPTPGTISAINIIATPNTAGSYATYNITFTPSNPINQTGGIIIIFPTAINISSGSGTVIGTSSSINTSPTMLFSGSTNYLTISNIFNSRFMTGSITLNLTGIINPLTTIPTSNFNFSTYDNITDLSTLIDTDFGTNFVSSSNTIPGTLSLSPTTLTVNDIVNYIISYTNGVALSASSVISVIVPS